MSSVIIFGFDTKGKSYELSEVDNAWLGGYSIWKFLCEKYLKKPFVLKDVNEVWRLSDSKDITGEERIVLFSTFDRMIVRKSELPILIDALLKFEAQETNLEKQAVELKEIHENNKDIEFVGFHQNSISCDMWDNCMLFDTKHYYMFDEIENDLKK